MYTDYQTPQSYQDEFDVAARVTPWLGGTLFRHLPENYALDWGLHTRHGIITDFLEVKCNRNLRFGSCPAYHVSMAKVMRAEQLFRSSRGVPCHLAIKLADGIFLCNLFDHMDGCRFFGRTDRPNDDKAIEPCVAYDWKIFEQVPE